MLELIFGTAKRPQLYQNTFNSTIIHDETSLEYYYMIFIFFSFFLKLPKKDKQKQSTREGIMDKNSLNNPSFIYIYGKKRD